MSEDWIVRGSRPAEFHDLLTALNSLVPHLAIRADSSEQWVVVVDNQDRPHVWISNSRSHDGVGEPTFATEMCASGTEPVAPYATPHGLVRDVARTLATQVGGQAERLSAATVPEEADERIPVDTGLAQQRSNATNDCPADSVTDELAIVVQSRPVITLSPWLILNQQWAERNEKTLVVLAPAAAALSAAASSMLQASGGLWVADTGTSLFHGHLGLELRWDGKTFVAESNVDQAYAPLAEDEWTLLVQAETMHPYDNMSRMGDFTSAIYEAAQLPTPMSVGVLEPAEASFDTELVTKYAQQASPRQSRLVVASPGADGVLEILPQPPGVVERIEITADSGDQPLDAGDLTAFVNGALSAGAQIAMLGYRRSTAGRRVPSRLTGPTIPAAAVFAMSRFPSLTDAEALRLGGATARLIDKPARALVVQFDVSSDGVTAARGDGEADYDHPAARLVQLTEGLSHHDSHIRAATASSN